MEKTKYEFKGSQGKWYDTLSNIKTRGVRNEGGYICFLPPPTHYPGQIKRYNQELEENKADAKLIAAAPEILAALIEISEGKGRFDYDMLKHAENTIEDMIQVAKEAIEKALNINPKSIAR